MYAQRKKLPPSMKFYVSLLFKKQKVRNMDINDSDEIQLWNKLKYELEENGPQFYKDFFKQLQKIKKN